jgi:predicted HTH domain antitoxin
MGLAVASVQLPEEILTAAHIPKENLDKECQKMVAMELYRKGYISIRKACEIANISM